MLTSRHSVPVRILLPPSSRTWHHLSETEHCDSVQNKKIHLLELTIQHPYFSTTYAGVKSGVVYMDTNLFPFCFSKSIQFCSILCILQYSPAWQGLLKASVY